MKRKRGKTVRQGIIEKKMDGKTDTQQEEKRVRIADIAEELGLSTATVSNVIHGKTKKVSEETTKRVQHLLEERGYIPSMAGILLAQNDSKIIGVIIQDDVKYEGRTLQDPFVYGSIDYLLETVQEHGFEMMIRRTRDCAEVVRYASMWNMSGLVMIGFCEQDYEEIRSKMHIPLVVYDGFFHEMKRFGNVSVDDFDGGYQMGKYLLAKGHRKILFLADNEICMDKERYEGLCAAVRDYGPHTEAGAVRQILPMARTERIRFYERLLPKLPEYTAAFCASDYYAIEFMNVLARHGICVGKDFSVAGFDDIPMAERIVPALTTIRQDLKLRAQTAMKLLMLQKQKDISPEMLNVRIPVELVERDSVKDCT